MTEPLSDRDRAVLEFAGRRYRHAGSREQAIRDEFGLSAVRYTQILNRLIDTEAAVMYDPVLVHRLQDLRDQRLAQRSLRRLMA